MTDEIDGMFAMLRNAPFRALGADPNAIAYETQAAGIAPVGFMDQFEGPNYDLISGGLYNGLFATQPTISSSNINNQTNPLPGWSFVQSSGTGVTAKWISDATVSGGGKVRLSIASGAAGDEGYLEQIISVVGGIGRALSPNAYFAGPVAGTAGAAKYYISADFLKSDKSTTTGTQGIYTDTIADLVSFGNNPPADAFPGNISGHVPADAAFLRVRIGLKRDAAVNTAAGSVDVYDAHLRRGDSAVMIAETQTPGTYGPSVLDQSLGTLRVRAMKGTANAPTLTMQATGLTGWLTMIADQAIFTGALEFTGWLGKSFSARQDNLNLEASAIGFVWTLTNTSGAAKSVTGMATGGIGQSQGDMRLLMNFGTGANDIALTHQDVNSTPGNRFWCPGAATATMNPGDSVLVIYDGTDWRLISR